MRPDDAARAVLVVLLALTLYLMYLIFKPFLPGIAWAIVLVVAFEPFYARLVRWLRGREWAAAILLSALLAAFIVVPTVIVVLRIAQGLADAYARLQEWTASGGSILAQLETHPWTGGIVSWARQHVDLGALDAQAMTLAALRTAGSTLASQTGAFVVNSLQMLLVMLVVLITTAVLFHEGPRVLETTRRYLPLSPRDKVEVLAQLRDVTRAVFFGVLLTALVQAILGAIGFVIVGIPNAALFGAAMFLCALLPAGTAVVWAPAAIWLFVTGHSFQGGFLLLWGVLVVSLVDNLLRPLFIRRGVRMPTILVFFGTLGGVLAFGLIGLFTGPLVITVFLFLLEVARRDFFREEEIRAVPTDAPPTI